MPKKEYKTSKKYQCPYCDMKLDRGSLIDHINRKHEEMIPQGYTAARVVYEVVNKKNHGTCMICKKDVYTWNDKLCRYNNLCDDKKCKEQVRKIAVERHIRVYNKPTLLNDPDHQEKMLERRKISKKYIFSDGGTVTYTGTYEGKTLEFMDKVLHIKSSEIQAPGPVLKYEFNGEEHFWITDIYYIPANLVIEVKDGGNNPNNRSMPEYRAKQLAKETMITSMGTMHYLRLTNNNFEQLLDVLADIKMGYMDNEDPVKARIHINEYMAMGSVNPIIPTKGSMLVIPYGLQNTFDNDIINGVAFMRPDDDDVYFSDLKEGLRKGKRKELANMETRIIRLEKPIEVIDEFFSNLEKNNEADQDIIKPFLNSTLKNLLSIIIDENTTIIPNDIKYKDIENLYESKKYLIYNIPKTLESIKESLI